MKTSAVNHTGKLIRISIKSGANRDQVAVAVERQLQTLKSTPIQVGGAELTKALQNEVWRGIDRTGELTLIEYRKVSLDRVRAFAEQEKLDANESEKMLKLAEAWWDRAARDPGIKKANVLAYDEDWSKRRDDFTKSLIEASTALLTAGQLDRLRQESNVQFMVRPVPAQTTPQP